MIRFIGPHGSAEIVLPKDLAAGVFT